MIRIADTRALQPFALAASAALALALASCGGATGGGEGGGEASEGGSGPEATGGSTGNPGKGGTTGSGGKTTQAQGGTPASVGSPAAGGSGDGGAQAGAPGDGGSAGGSPGDSPDGGPDPGGAGSGGGGAGAPGADLAPKGPFTCNLVIGIAATGQWFGAGFENIVDNGKWEVMAVHSGFIQTWADPNGSFWGNNPSSACAMNAKNPDHVIMEALYLHWMDATVDQWVTQLVAVVKNMKAKWPNVKRIELGSFVRAPGDKPCAVSMPFKSWVKPEQDEAEAKVAAMFPDLVVQRPKFEVRSCADFGGNPPHYSGAGATATAKMLGDYYKNLQ